MRISLNWLKQYVEIDIPARELAERLTMVGLAVDAVELLGEKYEKFVVGEVLEVARHPKADKLTICKVNVGRDVLQIVCGAPNVAPRQKVPVGLVGAEIPRNQHDPDGKPFVLSQVKLRGIDSYGMICSEYELDLGDDKDGIMVLDGKTEPGIPLAECLGLNDTVFEIDVTPNRPDALSHIGVAREVAANLTREMKIPSVRLNESSRRTQDVASVKVIDTENCPRYSARVIMNVKIGSSPKWMQERLNAVGIRPINNIVDATNYVLMECGHPLHAFDYDKLSAHAIVVRDARDGEGFETLDHKVRTLRSDTPLICDAERPVAIAGVMGGINTEISDSTTNVLLESAYFKPQSIRRTSRFLGLSTEASQRFERGTDPNITVWAVDRAAQLIQETAGGEILHGVIDVYPQEIHEREVELRVEKSNETLGVNLNAQAISALLAKLSIQQIDSSSSPVLCFRVPTFRPDIEREIDLIEEVARVYGYDNIEDKNHTSITLTGKPPEVEFADLLRHELIGIGFREIVANSMQDVSTASLTSDKVVRIANPISKEMSALRTSLIPGMLEIVRNNIFHGTRDLRLFELGKVYFHDPDARTARYVENFVEEDRFLVVLSGFVNPRTWDQPARSVDIFDLKGEIQTLFQKIFLDNVRFIPYSTTKALTESGLLVEIHGEYAGQLGTVQRDVLTKFEIEQDVFVAELLSDVVQRHRRTGSTFKALPKYPPVSRDIAIVVDETMPAERIESEIRAAGGTLLRKVELFDVYTGSQAGEQKKSCAFALEFLSEDRTLEQQEVDRVMQQIMDCVSARLNATIRK